MNTLYVSVCPGVRFDACEAAIAPRSTSSFSLVLKILHFYFKMLSLNLFINTNKNDMMDT